MSLQLLWLCFIIFTEEVQSMYTTTRGLAQRLHFSQGYSLYFFFNFSYLWWLEVLEFGSWISFLGFPAWHSAGGKWMDNFQTWPQNQSKTQSQNSTGVGTSTPGCYGVYIMPLNMLVKVGQKQKLFDYTSRCLLGKSMNHSRQYSSYGSHFAVDGIYDPLEIRESVWYSMFVQIGRASCRERV